MISFRVNLSARNNSSPKGDGNGVSQYRGRGPRETIHPRKGTETRPAMKRRYRARETIHPRKGTETTEGKVCRMRYL